MFIPYWTSSNTGYNLITVDLTAFDNTPSIQLVFRYDTLDPLYDDFLGARIDNISLRGGNNQNPSPVSEPASLVLFCLGALGMVGGAWRRQDRE